MHLLNIDWQSKVKSRVKCWCFVLTVRLMMAIPWRPWLRNYLIGMIVQMTIGGDNEKKCQVVVMLWRQSAWETL